MWYQLGNNEAKVNHLFFMDDLRLYGNKTKKQTKTVWQSSKDVKMEFVGLKCAVVPLQRGKKTR